ncbi:MAG: SH3 domain-containing protein [Candidatus Omnitrophota bacterium]
MKRTRVLLTVSALIFLRAACLCSAENESVSQDAFASANEYYKKAEYEKAIIEYKKVLDKGYESEPLYYNMGNTYYKIGKLGEAILNYERAECLMPRDADLASNYGFARASIKAGLIPEKKGIWSWRPLNLYVNNFSVNELCRIASGAYVLVILLFVTAVVRGKSGPRQLVAIVLLIIFALLSAGSVYYKAARIKRAGVAITHDTEVLFGPFDSATKFFTLQEGMCVEILSEKDDWYKIRRVDGKVGWVKKPAVEKIANGKNL